MGRITVLVLVVCSILMFSLVLQTPPQIVRNSSIYQKYFAQKYFGPAGLSEAAVTQLLGQKTSPRHKVAATTRSLEVTAPAVRPTSAPAAEKAGANASSSIPSPSNTPDMQAGANLKSVSNDAAPVYSSNSSSSTVLQVLSKGQIVEVELEVSTPSGKWILVTVPRQNVSGFVRSDGVSPTPSGEQPSPVLPSQSVQ